jgi:hypothetical protein
MTALAPGLPRANCGDPAGSIHFGHSALMLRLGRSSPKRRHSRFARSEIPGAGHRLRNQAARPESFLTDCRKSCCSALPALGMEDRHRRGRLRETNRAENARLPIRRRERRMQGLKSLPAAQRLHTTQAAICNAFDLHRHMISKPMLRLFRARTNSIWAAAAA